ncbi:hypothetical protein ABZP36_022609 [Zizania latifolia]
MAGYPEENQHGMNGHEEEEEEEVEEVEGFDEEEGRPGRRGGRDGGDEVGYGDAGGDDGRASRGDSSGKIFVGGVAWETTEESFSKHFEKYGAITDSVIMKDKHTKMPRGFGFVTFSDPSVIDKVLEDEHVIDGRTVEVKRTVPREEMSSKDGPKTRKIFVGGLPSSLAEDELRDHFSSYGKIVEHQIMVDHSTGRSRGFGFVTFESEDSVERVISEGRMRDLGGKQVEIKKAEPKKHGSDHSSNGRSSHGGGGGYRSSYRSGPVASVGGGSGSGSSGGYGYDGGYRSAAGGYYDSTAYGYGRGGYGYGSNAGFGSGYGAGYGGSLYGSAYGAYGAYGGGAYGGGAYGGGAYGGGAYGGAPGGYGGAGGYGSYGGAGGAGGGRGSSRYHPYGK